MLAFAWLAQVKLGIEHDLTLALLEHLDWQLTDAYLRRLLRQFKAVSLDAGKEVFIEVSLLSEFSNC